MANKFENEGKYRLLYILQLLMDSTDPEHKISTNQIRAAIEERHGITSHRITVNNDIKILQDAGYRIGKQESTQNKYYITDRLFTTEELQFLLTAVRNDYPLSYAEKRLLEGIIKSLGSPFEEYKAAKKKTCPSTRTRRKCGILN